MRKIKKINGFLVVKFNDREKREYEGTALGEYGVIDAEVYTGNLDIDRGAMEYDDADTLEVAVELARGLESEEDITDEPPTYTAAVETNESYTEEAVEPAALIEGWTRRLATRVKSKHYPDTDPRTAAHELYGFKMALHQIGFLPESEVITDPDTFGAGRLDGPMPRNPEELLAFVCDERCKNRAGHTQEELDAICAKCPLGQLYEDAEAQDLRIRERSERALREHIEGVRHAEDTLTALLGGHEALAYLAALRDGQILQENECEHYAAQIAEAGAAWETVLEGVSFEDLSRLRHLLREVDEYIKDGGELFNGFQHETERIPAHRLEELHQLGTALLGECPENDCTIYRRIHIMAKLTPDATRTEHGLVINEKIIPWGAVWPKDSGAYKKGTQYKADRLLSGGTGKVKGVTIHNTNDLKNVEEDAEQYTRATWPNGNMNDARVHYYVDDINAWQNLREDEVGWHAGDGRKATGGNETTLSIEIIMDGSGSKEDRKAEENGVLLAALLLKKHGLSVNELYTHNHWMGHPDSIVQGARKNCPLYILPHWAQFKQKVAAKLTELNGGATTTEAGKTEIMGKAKASAQQMALFARSKNAEPQLPACSLEQLAQFFLEEGEAEGVRGDVAFAQSLHETGFFKYGGIVLPTQNNYAGIGALNGNAKGQAATFPDPRTGVRAQIQHLKAYASKEALVNGCVDPRFSLVTRGSAQYVEWLGASDNPNGKGWAVPGKGYGGKIVALLGQIMAFEVPQPSAPSEPEEQEPEFPAYQLEGLETLTEAGVINSPEFWRQKFSEQVTVGEMFGI